LEKEAGAKEQGHTINYDAGSISSLDPVPQHVALLDGQRSHKDVSMTNIKDLETQAARLPNVTLTREEFVRWQLCLRHNNPAPWPETMLWLIAQTFGVRLVLFRDNVILTPPVALTKEEHEFITKITDNPETTPYPSHLWEEGYRRYKELWTNEICPSLEEARKTRLRPHASLSTGNRFCPRGLELYAFIEPSGVNYGQQLRTVWVFKAPQQLYYPIIVGAEAGNSFMIDTTMQYFNGIPQPFTILTAVMQQLPTFPKWFAYAKASRAWRRGVPDAKPMPITTEFSTEITAARQQILEYLIFTVPRSVGWAHQSVTGWRRLHRPARPLELNVATMSQGHGDEDAPH
jgi:hypothetical protein